MRRILHIIAVLSLAAGCGGAEDRELTRDELLTPEACESCHPDHYRQWIGSSHAYAADDPVFVAMNARAQRETGGAYPTECVRCHAPVAVSEGATTDGLNLATVPSHLKGVTCFACHAMDDATPVTHTFSLSDGSKMFGGIDNPRSTGAHGSEYSDLLDRNIWRSTDMCGVCHDFSNRSGVHAHRTYTEWTESLFADTFSRSFLTCGGCHMSGSNQPIAVDGPDRRLHDHKFPGMNVALLDWPEVDAQRTAIANDLMPSIQARVCLTADFRPEVILDNVMGGHMWPSGDASTRRAWVELVVYKDAQVTYQSGVIADGTAVLSTRASDPDLWFIGDRLLDEGGDEVTFTWDAASLESTLLPPAVTADRTDPRFFHAVNRFYPSVTGTPDRMVLKVHVRPIGLDIVDALIDSDGLAASVRDMIPTFTLKGTEIEWTGGPGTCVPPLPR